MAKATTDSSTDPWPSGRRGRPGPTAADRHVGLRIRERRIQIGLSLAQLADGLGVTAQQARKYENGRNGVPADRLAPLAQTLGVPISWFFDGLPQDGRYAPQLPTRPRMLMDIVRNFDLIRDDERREALCQAARVFAVTQRPPGGNPDYHRPAHVPLGRGLRRRASRLVRLQGGRGEPERFGGPQRCAAGTWHAATEARRPTMPSLRHRRPVHGGTVKVLSRAKDE